MTRWGVPSRTRKIISTPGLRRRHFLSATLIALPVSACSSESDKFTSIQAAVDAAPFGGTVHIPPGRFHESVVIGDKNVSLVGAGALATTIVAKDGPGVTISETQFTRHWSLKSLTVESGQSEEHLIEVPFGLSQSIIDNVRLIQKFDRHSAFYCTRNEPLGGIFDCHFLNTLIQMNDTSKVPGVYISGPRNVASANLFQRIRLDGGGNYMIHLETSATSYCYNNHFMSINLERCANGGIRLLGSSGSVIDSIGVFDTPLIRDHVIFIGRSIPSGPRSMSSVVRGYQRTTGKRMPGAVDVYAPVTQNADLPRVEANSPRSVDLRVVPSSSRE